MSAHVVPPAVFDELASGRGSYDGALRAGQRSKRLLLLHELITRARASAGYRFTEAGGDDAAAVLGDAQRRARRAVDEVLLQPHVGAWASRCLRELLVAGSLSPKDLGHLAAIATAAALRAGLDCELTVYASDGTVMFPSFGSARAPVRDGWCQVRASRDARGVDIAAGDVVWTVPFGPASTPAWTPLRRLRATAGGLTLDVALDDLDPDRGCGHLPVASRLDDAAFERWRATMDEAWALLVGEHPHVAEATASAVLSIVPLAPTSDAPDLSATCFDALGAVAMTEPQTAVNMALALSHELQHTKLSALLDLVALVDPRPGQLFYAPWRKDPRPAPGLLQGTYAWLGLSDFWDTRLRRALESPDSRSAADLAGFELALARLQVRHAIDTLHRSERLTPAGQRFLAGMRRGLADLGRRPVAAHTRRLADLACLDHAVSWRLRNRRPAPGDLARWADAWLVGRSFPGHDAPPAAMRDGDGPLASDRRLGLIRRRLSASGGWTHEGPDGASPADVALITGDHARAATGYRTALGQDPDDLASWSGLALALAPAPSGASWALRTHPGLVASLHREVRSRCSTGPDVVRLADWVGRTGPV